MAFGHPPMSIEGFHLGSNDCTRHVRRKREEIAGDAPWQRRNPSRRDMHPGISSVVGCTLRRYSSSCLTAVCQSTDMVSVDYFVQNSKNKNSLLHAFQLRQSWDASRRVFASHLLAIIMVSKIPVLDPDGPRIHPSLRHPDVISVPGLPEYPAVLPF